MTLEDVAGLALPMIDEAEMLAELHDEIAALGSQTAWAKKHGLSLPYVNDLVHGRRPISAEVAQLLGHERLVVYVRTKPLDGETMA